MKDYQDLKEKYNKLEKRLEVVQSALLSRIAELKK